MAEVAVVFLTSDSDVTVYRQFHVKHRTGAGNPRLYRRLPRLATMATLLTPDPKESYHHA